MTPDHINAAHWDHALTVARQACARIFRDGGSPRDALSAFGLPITEPTAEDWSRAVDAIAETLCAKPVRQAA